MYGSINVKNSFLRLLHRLLVLSIFPSSLQYRVLVGSSYRRCDQSS